ncbi:MAG: histidine triad nucleotide-binding protein [Sphingomonadaceae bacterium]
MACIFCRIVAREIPSDIVYQDDRITAFRDINPQAPVHIVIVPNEHIPSVMELRADQAPVVGHMVHAAGVLAEREGVAKSGFRLVINNGPDAGQSVDHLHLHLLGGRPMQWPPG